MTLLAAATLWTGRVRAGQEQQSPLVKMPDGSEFLPEYARQPSMFRPATEAPNNILIDAPVNGTIYPPDVIAPQFKWRDNNPAATVWRVEINFGGKGKPIRVSSDGEKLKIPEVDASLSGYVPPTLSPEEQQMHAWRPDVKMWEEIKKRSTGVKAMVTISGYAAEKSAQPVSSAQATFETSRDAVGAPIFYRNVPLIPPQEGTTQRGVIKPLPDSVLPKIRWELRYINETHNHLMMTNLPTCGNCHSFSRDGKVMGIDVDGPANDKGLYALTPLNKVTTISNDYLVRWSAFSEEGGQKRFGFMSQVSPDGKYVVNSIDVPRAKGMRVVDRLYNGFYPYYGFGQVFYPTRGVLAWYSKESGKLQTLPGADDPNFVQTSAFWSPDGKWLIFSRATASNPYPAGYKRSLYANDPNETQVQYDLYRIPFNNGKGGVAEPVRGASDNGMSNNFPKVSPDGKWIVFVRCKNGLLMRPDSRLYIVPFEGGEARALESNLPVMNSWHSWSPNGKWLVFSSKSPSFYTRMYLTHIDEQGHASPPVEVENATASNRAVNIPEFLNIGANDLDHIETPAIDYYREFDTAQQLQDEAKYAEAIPAWKVAAAKDPTDARPFNNLGVALAAMGQFDDAIDAYKRSLTINPESSQTHNNFGSALAEAGRLDEAMENIRTAIELNPDNGAAHVNLGHMLEVRGGAREEAKAELRKGIELAPKLSDGHNVYGVILAREGQMDEAIAELQTAVDLAPRSAECQFNLGRAMAASNRFADAVPHFEAAASLTGGKEPAILQMLAGIYSDTGQYAKAVDVAQRALDIAEQRNDRELAQQLRANLSRYRSQMQTGQQ
ncbi:tetratricopeptide repeat protein [Occallatibacter riparius]|uniref:Tetratricopeptide repeat protein n=1 Tax=Occallatibacter riparius TaxID=1002689 RepID=A0A9J7BMW1_9BACT|nr:tetratricopeptide repeat protein [Occallatibacter riparius]UWZ82517.1 tetratricopeptide repeat protein [Occallatibacter riparius]